MNNECPICKAKIKGRCRCPLSDSECINGHSWHLCLKHKKIVSGASDHSAETLECHCHDYKDNVVLGDY
jgi:hypothetical protein